jgi:ATP-dependent helicase/nuclease subunit A
MYLTSDIYDLILLSNNIKREYNVTFKAPLNLYDSNLDGEVLTEGVIDLLFELDDIYYIVDYKTDNVNDMEELKELYKVQLDLYEIAIKQLLNAKKVKKYIYSIKLNKFKEV